MVTRTEELTLYEQLQVHPSAPLDLITAVYWRLVGRIQTARGSGRSSDAEAGLYHLTRAYEALAHPNGRAAYDRSIGVEARPLVPDFPFLRRRVLLSGLLNGRGGPPQGGDSTVDYYEILRLDPRADQTVVAEASSVMRNHYLRLVREERARDRLVALLEEAHAVLSDPARRQQYDKKRRMKWVQNGNGESKLTTRAVTDGGSRPARPQRPAVRRPNGQLVPEMGTEPEREVAAELGVPEPPASRLENSAAAAEPAQTGSPARVHEEKVEYKSPDDDEASTDPGEYGSGLVQGIATMSGQLLGKASEQIKLALNGPAHLTDEELEAAERALMERIAASPAPVSEEPSGRDRGTRVLAKLVVTEGESRGQSFDVLEDSCTVGSDERCDVRLAGLAEEQVRLLYRDGSFVLYRLAEDPETRIHGDVVDWAVLEDGDVVELGAVKVRFESLAG